MLGNGHLIAFDITQVFVYNLLEKRTCLTSYIMWMHVLTGSGFGLIYAPCSTIVSFYFKEKKK